MELEGKRYEVEMREMERIGEEKRKQKIFDENILARKRESMQKARDIKKEKERIAKLGPQLDLGYRCEECEAALEGRAPTHTSDLIRHAVEKHAAKLAAGLNGSRGN
jgi:hypothetical protein